MNPFFHTKFRVGFFTAVFAISSCFPDQQAAAQDLITTMTEQIAKLEVYLEDTKKGYSIVQQGLNTISQIKKGDFDLHSLFFTSLKEVNPNIKNWGKIADILAMQLQILVGSETTLRQFTSSGAFNGQDLKYLSTVYENLKDLTAKDIDELLGIITDGTWQMTDDQRITRIDKLYQEVTNKYTFLRAFSDRVYLQQSQKAQEKASLQNITKLIAP